MKRPWESTGSWHRCYPVCEVEYKVRFFKREGRKIGPENQAGEAEFAAPGYGPRIAGPDTITPARNPTPAMGGSGFVQGEEGVGIIAPTTWATFSSRPAGILSLTLA